jgi:hypothetical protein
MFSTAYLAENVKIWFKQKVDKQQNFAQSGHTGWEFN